MGQAEPWTCLCATGKQLTDWPVEDIPDEAFLFYRIHKMYPNQPDGTPGPGAFRDHNGGMSTDWDRYSSAVECREQVPAAADNGVVRLNAGRCRSEARQEVRHTPWSENRAHTDVIGEKKGSEDPKPRMLLARISECVIEKPAGLGDT